ncbi:FUSC family protein [Streptomyces sp. NPDC096033]|uniref:FUSC family protein n=1 Tax=Streptomyces sp. NPDC096033 TaxID=3366071 RepID=UPI00382CCA48
MRTAAAAVVKATPWDRALRSAIATTVGLLAALAATGPAGSALVVIGAVCSVNADHSGGPTARARRLAGAVGGGVAGILIGTAATVPGPRQIVALAVAGLAAGLLGGWGPGRGLAGLKLMVLTSVSTGLPATITPPHAVALYLLGCAPMAALLAAAWVIGEPGRRVLGPLPLEPVARPRPLTCPRRLAASLRLALCLAAAAALAAAFHPEHASWLLMTTALVFRIDDVSVFHRVTHRAVGTIGGVLAATVLVRLPPGWATLTIALVVGALLPGLTDRAYALHAALVSVIVLVLATPTAPSGPDSIAARLVDTLIACGLALLMGYVIWPDRRNRLTTVRPAAERASAPSAPER